jgi:hypothetical protein
LQKSCGYLHFNIGENAYSGREIIGKAVKRMRRIDKESGKTQFHFSQLLTMRFLFFFAYSSSSSSFSEADEATTVSSRR